MATPKLYVNGVLTVSGRPGDSAEQMLTEYLGWFPERTATRIDWGRAVQDTDCFPGQCDCHRPQDAAAVAKIFGQSVTDYRHHYIYVTGSR